MKWLPFTILVLAGVLLLLATGASPLLGTPGIYRSGVFLLLSLVVAFLSLYAAIKLRRKPAMFLLHLGGVLVIAGAFLDLAKEQKLSFTLPLGPQYATDFLREDDSLVQAQLPFSIAAKDFHVEYYPQTFTLFQRDGTKIKKAEDGYNRKDEVLFAKHDFRVPQSRLKDGSGAYLPFLFLNEEFVVLKDRPTEKYYRADFLVIDGDDSRTQELAVNHPVTHKGWRFYLVSHGASPGGTPFVKLTARNAPGRYWVIPGIYLLIAGSFWFAFKKKRKAPAQ